MCVYLVHGCNSKQKREYIEVISVFTLRKSSPMGFQGHVFVISLCLLACDSKLYHKYPLYLGIPSNAQELEFYKNLAEAYDVIYWKEPGSLFSPVHFTINPDLLDTFNQDAKYNNITLNVVIKDIQKAFDKQIVRPYINTKLDSFTWKGFYRLDAIYKWLDDLQNANPHTIRLEKIGMSVEKRFIYAVHLKYASAELRPKIIIEGGIHGREWMSPAFVTYLINELVNAQHSQSSELRTIAIAYEWLFVPVLNPDGYEYSHTTDRLWSKNRRFDHGVDLNRNFAIAFGAVDEISGKGSQTFGGETEFSEPETRAMAQFVEKNKENLKYYLAFHSYGQNFIIPYSFTRVHLDNYDDVKSKAASAMARLSQKFGTEYTVGTMFETLGYLASGASTCWAKKVYNIPYVATIRLRDTGTYGFALPSEKILPTCLETMDALYVFLKPIVDYYPQFRTPSPNTTIAEREDAEDNYQSRVAPHIVIIFTCFCLT